MNISIFTYLIPVLLSLDVFFLSISGGVTLRPYNWISTLKISLAFIFSQLLAAIIGLFFGEMIQPLLKEYSLWASSLLIGFFAFKMIQEAIKIKNTDRTFLLEDNQILWPIALASSLSTMVFFVGLGLLNVDYHQVLPILFFSILFFSQIGLFIGSHYQPLRLGRSSKLVGGIIILAIVILNYIL